MNELRALLAGIARHPTDDLRRWVLADWLDDHNFFQGELLRAALQYRNWEREPIVPHPFRQWLAGAIPRLLPTVQPLRERGIGYAINCGLVDEVELSLFQLARCGRWLTELYPLRSIRLRWHPGDRAELHQLMDYDNLRAVQELVLDPLEPTNLIPPLDCRELFALPLFENLQQLVIFFFHWWQASQHYEPELLFGLLGRRFAQLRGLRLIGTCWEKGRFFELLRQHPLIHQLEFLDLDEMVVDAAGALIDQLAELPPTLRRVAIRVNLFTAIVDEPGSDVKLMDRLLALRLDWAKRGRELHLNEHWTALPLDSWRELHDPLHNHFPGATTYGEEISHSTDLADSNPTIADWEEETSFGRVVPGGVPETPTRREERRGRFRNPRPRD